MGHHKSTKQSLSPTNFKILCNSNKSDIRLLESMYIHNLKPKLNNNTAYGLYSIPLFQVQIVDMLKETVINIYYSNNIR